MRVTTLLLFLFLLFVQPLSAQAKDQVSATVNGNTHIFLLHEIGQGPHSLYVPEQDFERLIDHLKKEGYKSVTVSQLLDSNFKREAGDKLVALTFDDGYASFYEKAYPILKKYNYTATIFIITDMIDTPNHMTWTQLRKLMNEGVEVGSHSATHPYLSKLDSSSLQKQVEGSKQKLEEMLNKKVTDFCYPYGDFNDDVIESVRKAGYKSAVTVHTDISSAKDNLYQLPRINVYGGMSNHTLDTLLTMKPGQFDSNITNYFLAIDLNKDDANAYLQRGMAFESIGNHREAISDYTKALEINPNFSEAYNGRGWVYNELGQYERAISDYTNACTLAPQFSYPYNNRASAYIKAEKYAEAIQDLNTVIEIDPSFPYLASTYNKRGYAYAKLQDYDKALIDCNKSIELKNDYADAYHSRGYAYYLSANYEKALSDFQKAIELDKTKSLYFYNISKAYEALGQKHLANNMLQKSLELDLQEKKKD